MKCVHRIQILAILITSLQALIAGQGFAEDVQAEPTQWSVGIGIPIGLQINDVKANSRTGFIGSPSRVFDDLGQLQFVRSWSTGDSRVTGVTFGGDLEIVSPTVFDVLGQPKFFARSALEMNLAADTKPATEGGIGPVRLPTNAAGEPPPTFTVNSVLGQGTEALHKVHRLQVRVGAGMAFSFVFNDRPIRIKPSIEYLRHGTEMRGAVNAVIQLPGTPPLLTSLSQTRIEEVRTTAKRTFHGIGPGLELELETGQLGPLAVTVYGGFRAYRFLGTRDEKLKGQTSAGEPVEFEFEIDKWLYRADTGLRFRWQPE